MSMPVRLEIYADTATVWALAQFIKRVRFEHFRECAVNEDEAYLIRDGVAKLGEALADKGFTPR